MIRSSHILIIYLAEVSWTIILINSVVLIIYSLAHLTSPHIALANPNLGSRRGLEKSTQLWCIIQFIFIIVDYRVDTSTVFWFQSLLHSSKKLFHTSCGVLGRPKPPLILWQSEENVHKLQSTSVDTTLHVLPTFPCGYIVPVVIWCHPFQNFVSSHAHLLSSLFKSCHCTSISLSLPQSFSHSMNVISSMLKKKKYKNLFPLYWSPVITSFLCSL